MNILIITSHMNPGGISRYVINIVKGLSGKHSLFVASSGGEWEERLEKLGCKHIFIPLSTKSIFSLKVFKSFFILKRFISAYNIDLVHAHTRVSQFLAYLIWRLLNIPYVSTFHGYYRPHIFRKIFKFEGLLTISISKAVKEHLVLELGIKSDKIRIVYNGIDKEEFKKVDREEIKKKFNIRGSPLIGIISRLSEEKNHQVLINAFSSLINDFPDANLIIAGRGRLKNFLKDMAREKNIEDKTFFLEAFDSWEILSILDVFVLPSLKEGFGFSVIEAQYIGVPVIVSRAGGLGEIVEDKETGLVINESNSSDLYEAIKLILKDKNLRDKIITNARQKVEREFLLDKMTKGIENVYREVLNGG